MCGGGGSQAQPRRGRDRLPQNRAGSFSAFSRGMCSGSSQQGKPHICGPGSPLPPQWAADKAPLFCIGPQAPGSGKGCLAPSLGDLRTVAKRQGRWEVTPSPALLPVQWASFRQAGIPQPTTPPPPPQITQIRFPHGFGRGQRLWGCNSYLGTLGRSSVHGRAGKVVGWAEALCSPSPGALSAEWRPPPTRAGRLWVPVSRGGWGRKPVAASPEAHSERVGGGAGLLAGAVPPAGPACRLPVPPASPCLQAGAPPAQLALPPLVPFFFPFRFFPSSLPHPL